MIHPLVKGGTSLLDPTKILETVGVHEGATVADLGCGGAGHFVAPTARFVGDKGRVFAVDIQKIVLHNVEGRLQFQKITNVSTIWSNLEKVGSARIPEYSCDFAFLVNVLFQNSDHLSILREAARMLKSGTGVLVIIEWKKSASPIGPALEFRVDPASILALAREAGLSYTRAFDPGVYHYGLIFKS